MFSLNCSKYLECAMELRQIISVFPLHLCGSDSENVVALGWLQFCLLKSRAVLSEQGEMEGARTSGLPHHDNEIIPHVGSYWQPPKPYRTKPLVRCAIAPVCPSAHPVYLEQRTSTDRPRCPVRANSGSDIHSTTTLALPVPNPGAFHTIFAFYPLGGRY